MKTLLRNAFFATALIGSCITGIHAQQEVAQSDSETVDTKSKMDVDNHPLLQKYTWVQTIVNPKDCKNETVALYYNKASKTNYIIVEAKGYRVMYNEEGQVHCTDSKTLDCAKYYELVKQPDAWSCAKL